MTIDIDELRRDIRRDAILFTVGIVFALAASFGIGLGVAYIVWA